MRIQRFELAAGDAAALAALAAEIRALAAPPPDVQAAVAEILAAVRERGDQAVAELTERFDGAAVPPGEAGVRPAELAAALAALDPGVREGLELMAENVRAVTRAQRVQPEPVTLAAGHTVEQRFEAVRSAGIYAPGGRAAYPSTVVMCCVPAVEAGVERIAVTTPPQPDGAAHPVVLAACALCGVDEVYRMGGAQSIAALAYGTASVDAVDVIVGPGTTWVQEAKRQLAGSVGIDGLAGPSELAIVAGAGADPELCALDLCAQAEHGEDTLLVLVSPAAALLDAVEQSVTGLAATRPSVREAPLALVQSADLEQALDLTEALAPEHLELACPEAVALAGRVRRAGCLFLGREGATAFGDYAAGSNHVLPTGGAARFQSALGLGTFQRRMAVVTLTEAAAGRLGPHVGNVARAEGFPVHGESAEARIP